MKKIFKILGILVLALFMLATGTILYFKTAYPKVNAPESITIEVTPERVARGKYLTSTSVQCLACHTEKQSDVFGMPPKEEGIGAGGQEFNIPDFGIHLYSANITPDKETGIGSWTDGEIFRAVTEGIGRDGKPLAIMPFSEYAKMDREEIYSIIAYIKTLPAVKRSRPESELGFIADMIFRTQNGAKAPLNLKADYTDKAKLGEFLFAAADCQGCHTPLGSAGPDMERFLAGGMEFKMSPTMSVFSGNITPDKETGIGNWTREQFIGRFKAYNQPDFKPYKITDPEQFNTEMPWVSFSKMSEEELGAIYDYLMTQKPVHNKVEKMKIKRF